MVAVVEQRERLRSPPGPTHGEPNVGAQTMMWAVRALLQDARPKEPIEVVDVPANTKTHSISGFGVLNDLQAA